MNNTVFVGLILVFIAILASAANASEAWVRVSPGFLNTIQCQSMMGKIYIESDEPMTYDISITGVPEDWLDYPEKVYVEGKETVTYLINPSDPGTYRLYFHVESADFEFEEDVKLWVSGKETSDANPVKDDSGLEGGLSGMFVSAENQVLFIYALVAIGAALAVLLGHSMLKQEEDEDKVY